MGNACKITYVILNFNNMLLQIKNNLISSVPKDKIDPPLDSQKDISQHIDRMQLQENEEI